MFRSVLSKVAWVGRTASMVFGLALVLGLMFGVASMAFAANGQSFILGSLKNSATAVSKLTMTGTASGPVLQLVQQSTGLTASGLGITVPAGKAPLTVNSTAGKATNLNADKIDSLDSTQLAQGTNGIANNADKLDNMNSTDFATQAGLNDEANTRANADTSLSNQLSNHNHDAAYVNETDHTKAAHDALDIDADTLDGQDSTAFLGAGQKAADADRLDGLNSTDFAAANHRHSTPIGVFGGVVGSFPASSTNWVFAGASGIPRTASVTVASGQRLTGSASASLGISTAGSVNSSVDIALCFQPSAGGTISNFSPNYLTTTITDRRGIVSTSESVSNLAAGTYNVGLCVRNRGTVDLNSNDFVSGWVMVTNN